MATAPTADTIVLGRKVHSLVHPEEHTDGQAVIITDGKIQAIVDEGDIAQYSSENTEVLDFGSSVIMPGFVDPHAHVEVGAVSQHGVVDVRVPKCKTIDEVLAALKSGLNMTTDGWLVAQGNLFFDRKLEDGRFPTREELDSVSREVAIIVRAGGHLSILNSVAMERSGITADFSSSHGSITGAPTVERDASGQPTGVIMEMDNLIPFPRLDESALESALSRGVSELFTSFGVTTVGEISETISGLKAFRSGILSGEIAARMHAYLWVPGTTRLTSISDPSFIADVSGGSPDLFSVRGVKVFSDGGFSAAMAAISTEYEHVPGSCGTVALSFSELEEIYAVTREAGLHLAIHANGDRAQLEVCEAIIKAREKYGDHPQVRIEHAGNYVPDYETLTTAWKKAGIVPVPQPIFIKNFGEFVPDYVGGQAWDQQFPFNDLLRDGWELSGSSDVWIGSDYHQTNPLVSIAATIDRLTFHGKTLGSDQAISHWQALRMHTGGGAKALGKKGEVGVLAPKAHADLIVLNQDPLTTPSSELNSIEVEKVIFGGSLVNRPQ